MRIKTIVANPLRAFHIVRMKIMRRLPGYTDPPFTKPEVKRSIVGNFGKRGYTTLIETGTELGNMIEHVRSDFTEIYSVELGEELYQKATERFKKFSHIHLYQGDSATWLPEIVRKIDRPSLFWLDAHYSGGITVLGKEFTPVLAELHVILKRNLPDTILIDDARLFDGIDYPTLNRIKRFVRSLRPGMRCTVDNDMVYILPEFNRHE